MTPDGLEPDDDAYAAFGYADVAAVVEGLAAAAPGGASEQASGLARSLTGRGPMAPGPCRPARCRRSGA